MYNDPEKSGFFIRLARAADIPAIRAMQERSMVVLGSQFYTENELSNFLTLFGTMDDAVVDEGHYFVAENHNGAILGSGGWTCLRPSYAKAMTAGEISEVPPTVRSVFVDPAATRRGIASAIMSYIEHDARDHGIDMLFLTATLSGAALYEALGYCPIEATELAFPDQSRFKCIRMQKSLRKWRSRAA